MTEVRTSVTPVLAGGRVHHHRLRPPWPALSFSPRWSPSLLHGGRTYKPPVPLEFCQPAVCVAVGIWKNKSECCTSSNMKTAKYTHTIYRRWSRHKERWGWILQLYYYWRSTLDTDTQLQRPSVLPQHHWQCIFLYIYVIMSMFPLLSSTWKQHWLFFHFF